MKNRLRNLCVTCSLAAIYVPQVPLQRKQNNILLSQCRRQYNGIYSWVNFILQIKLKTLDVSPRSAQYYLIRKIFIFPVLCNSRKSLAYYLVKQIRMLFPHPFHLPKRKPASGFILSWEKFSFKAKKLIWTLWICCFYLFYTNLPPTNGSYLEFIQF